MANCLHSPIYEFFRDQGSIVAGLLAFLAGLVAFRAGWLQARATREAAENQANVERQKRDDEVVTLRKSIAIELRQLVGRALMAHSLLKKLSVKVDGPISDRMVESFSRVPPAIVYPAVADRISLLGEEAMDVVITYSLIEIARGGVAQLLRDRTPDDIRAITVAGVAEAFLRACDYAMSLLPRLRTGVPEHDKRDDDLAAEVAAARRGWEAFVDEFKRT